MLVFLCRQKVIQWLGCCGLVLDSSSDGRVTDLAQAKLSQVWESNLPLWSEPPSPRPPRASVGRQRPLACRPLTLSVVHRAAQNCRLSASPSCQLGQALEKAALEKAAGGDG
ncbi:unnamed protein product [Boreogadus saida]